MSKIIGVDVGGTFTDIVEYDGVALVGRKIPTSQDQSIGVASAVTGTSGDQFLHGTTAATNALLEERGARVALVTNSGYEDLIEIGRQDRPSLYDSAVDRPPSLVKRDARIADGPDLVQRVLGAQPEAVAVMLVESYLDPSREQEIADMLRDDAIGPGPGVVFGLSRVPRIRKIGDDGVVCISDSIRVQVLAFSRRATGHGYTIDHDLLRRVDPVREWSGSGRSARSVRTGCRSGGCGCAW